MKSTGGTLFIVMSTDRSTSYDGFYASYIAYKSDNGPPSKLTRLIETPKFCGLDGLIKLNCVVNNFYIVL